jgi:hypothetical protein
VPAAPDSGRLRDALAVPVFRVLATSYLVVMLGGSIAAIAMTVLVYASTGSTLLAAVTFALLFLPYLVAGAGLSAITDRWPPRRLLVTCQLTVATILAVMAVPAMTVGARLGLLAVVGLISPIAAGATNAVVARSLPGPAYVPGRAIMRVIAQGAQIFGAAAGGALLVAISPAGVLAVDAVGYAGSALLLWVGLPRGAGAQPAEPAGPDDSGPGLVVDSLRGVRRVLAVPTLRRALLLSWWVPFFMVAPEALGAPYVALAGLPPSAIGLWYVAIPLGDVIGALAAVWTLSPHQRRRLIRPLALVLAVCVALAGLAPTFWMAWTFLLVAGMASAYGLGLDRYTLDVTPAALTARMFTVQSTGLMVWQGVGFTVWGALAEQWPPSTVIVAAGTIAAVVVLALRLTDRERLST